MSFLKKLAGQAATYGVSSILGRVINFLLVPFYTDPDLTGIKPADFGIYTELYAYMAFLNVVYLFGMETAFFRFSTRDKELKANAYNSALSAIILISVALSGLLVIFSGPLSHVLSYPEKQSYLIFLAVILAVDAIVAIPFAKLRLENKAKKFATLKLANIFLNVFFNFFFLYFCRQIYLGNFLPSLQPVIAYIYIPDFEVGYIILSNLFANASLILFLKNSFKEFRFSIDKSLLKSMMIYAYPLMFMGLAGMVNEVLDRILLRIMLPEGFYSGKSTLEVVGIYGACYKLSMFMSLAIQAFRYAAEPFFFSQAKDKNAPSQFATIMKYFIISCTLIYVLVGSNLPFFGHILRDETYREGLLIVPVLLLANLFLGAYINLSVWYKLTDKTYAGTVITFIGAGITILSNVLLIPILGYFGSAIATLICYAGMAGVAYVWGQKHFPVPYQLGNAAFYIGLATLLIWVSIMYFNFDGFVRLAAGLAVFVFYVLLIFILERNSLKSAIREG